MLAMLFIATFFDTPADSREWGVENHGDHSDHSETVRGALQVRPKFTGNNRMKNGIDEN